MNAVAARLLDTRLGRLAVQFGKFGMVGLVGLVVDMAVVGTCVRVFGLDAYISRVISYLFAATTTWGFNRIFTFRGVVHQGVLRQWAMFLAANAVGGVVNYGTYATLITSVEFFRDYPEAATAVGSVAGMLFNFAASKKYVFKAR